MQVQSTPATTPWSVTPLADASALLQDLRHGAVNGCDGILGLLARTGQLAMSAQAVEEVDAHLHDVAADVEQAEAMTVLWTVYRERVTIVTGGVVDLDVVSVGALADRDPDDLHLIAAALQHDSVVILSDDRDLRDLGLAPPSWLEGARSIMTISCGDATVHVASIGLDAAAEAVAGTWRAARDGSIPAVITIAAVVAATAYLLADTQRRRHVLQGLLGVLHHMLAIEQDRQIALASIGPFINLTAARIGTAPT